MGSVEGQGSGPVIGGGFGFKLVQYWSFIEQGFVSWYLLSSVEELQSHRGDQIGCLSFVGSTQEALRIIGLVLKMLILGSRR